MIDLFGNWSKPQEIGEISQRVNDNIQDLRNNWTQAVQTQTTKASVNLEDAIKSSAWTELKFNTGEEEIVFKGKEIKYLKEMLDSYIKENHPEELL